jgi:hypothetical protein
MKQNNALTILAFVMLLSLSSFAQKVNLKNLRLYLLPVGMLM